MDIMQIHYPDIVKLVMKIAQNVALKKYVMCVKIICYFKEMYAMILVKQEIILYLVIKV